MKANAEWQLSSNAAEYYEQFLLPTIFVPWAEELLARAKPKPGESVLDVACGTGIVARLVTEKVGLESLVVGTDLNAGMLDVARAKSLEAGKSIEWIEADVTALPLEDAEFDIAICQQGLQFFPDKVGALKEIRRLLNPGGRFVACVARGLDHNPLMQSQVDAFTKHINEEAAASIRAVCSLADADELRGLFVDAGFSGIRIENVALKLIHENGLEFITGAICATPVASVIAEWGDKRRSELLKDILIGFGEYYNGERLAFPHVSYVVTAVSS